MNKKQTAKQIKHRRRPAHMANWLDLLAYLAYLRYLQATRSQPPANVQISHVLIVAMALVLTVVALVAAGAPQYVVDILKYWPLHP